MNNRRDRLVNYLREHGKTAVNELAKLFDTSGATIRSDLRRLEQEMLVVRRYGSAEACFPPLVSTEDMAMNEKKTINLNIKMRIARKAAELINAGDSIILDCGSTTLQMIPELEKIRSLTLMTNSMDIVNEMADLDSEHTVIMPGGTFRKKSDSFHGSLAEKAFSQFSFDKLFIGADGFDAVQGCTTYNEAYQVSQAMCQSANEVIVVMDSSKFGRRSPNVVVPIEKIDVMITDTKIAGEDLARLEEKGITVYQV